MRSITLSKKIGPRPCLMTDKDSAAVDRRGGRLVTSYSR